MRIIASIVLIGILAISASMAMGSPSTVGQTETVNVSVSPVELMSLPAPASVNLTAAVVGAPDSGRAVMTQCAGSGLAFAQNSGIHKIVVQATHDSGNPTNDLLLRPGALVP